MLKTHISTRQKVDSYRVPLENGNSTMVHVAKYLRVDFHPRLVLFEKETGLLDWCVQNEVPNASGGGFFLREKNMPRGDLWINGKKLVTVPSISPWNLTRGSLHISTDGEINIAPRNLLPATPAGDLLEAGPLLVSDSRVVVKDGVDSEGYTDSFLQQQNDSDITDGRYPRLAIGQNKEYFYSVACDGYGGGEAGLTMEEFARTLVSLGINEALNLDGGSSATVICNYKLVNKPRGGDASNFARFVRGRPIFSAIVFDTKLT